MSSNTRLSGVLASCRIIILCLGVFSASPAKSLEDGTIAVVEAIPFRNLTYNDAEGKAHKLKNDLGKLTIVHFWATWCVPCIAELPELDAFDKKYKDQGVKVISIAEDGVKRMQNVQDFFKKHKVESLAPYLDIDTKAFQETQTRGLPTTYFIDPSGLKIAVAEGPMNWASKDAEAFVKLHLKAAQ
jgi:thiol-disulfide isomerase/thioredoxin